MSLFRPKFKKIEPQNVTTTPPQAPQSVQLVTPTPVQPQPEYYLPTIEPPKPIPQVQSPFEERLKKKVEEMKVKQMVSAMVIEILEGI